MADTRPQLSYAVRENGTKLRISAPPDDASRKKRRISEEAAPPSQTPVVAPARSTIGSIGSEKTEGHVGESWSRISLSPALDAWAGGLNERLSDRFVSRPKEVQPQSGTKDDGASKLPPTPPVIPAARPVPLMDDSPAIKDANVSPALKLSQSAPLKLLGARFVMALSMVVLFLTTRMFFPRQSRLLPDGSHEAIPSFHDTASKDGSPVANSFQSHDNLPTLRTFLSDSQGYSLALAPAFFGFYGYFGALAAWDEIIQDKRLHAVAGASAGAIAAILLGAGIEPRRAAEFCASITLSKFADFPGLGAVFRGNKFERIMADFLQDHSQLSRTVLEDALVPVAVSGFDLQTMRGQILTTGSMARAARASATFPFLFQPVGWANATDDYTLIDGGIADMAGVEGLKAILAEDSSTRPVINLKVGDFIGAPPGPESLPGTPPVISVTLVDLPMCGPLAMSRGPIAVDAAYQAMKAAVDVPLTRLSANHYELVVGTSEFWKNP